MSLVLLAGYMNTYTSNPAPIDPTGGFAGNTVTPFDYGTCPCHAAVQRSRDLVSVQRAATLAQSGPDGGGREPLQQHRVDR